MYATERNSSQAGYSLWEFEVYATTEVEPVLPATGFQLLQNFPNPFNPATTISYSLQSTGTVRLSIFDSLGQLVGTLVSAEQSAGSHDIQFSGNGLASGIYFYQLIADGRVSTREVVYVK